MAEGACRKLRDGGIEGEHAPALLIKDSSTASFGEAIFFHFLFRLLSDIVSGNSKSRGLVLVAFRRSPSYYLDFLKERGLDQDRIESRLRVLDCYTDPHGWIRKLSRSSRIRNCSRVPVSGSELFNDITDLDKLFSSTISLGQGLNSQGAGFSVAIDSVSELSSHTTSQSVARLLNNIRTSDQVFSAFYLVHTDFHHVREVAALEYISSLVVAISVPIKRPVDHPNTHFLPESFPRTARLLVRTKLRNGRVRVAGECFTAERRGVKFSPGLLDDVTTTTKGLLPKVQFNLQLSEKEVMDRAKVVLPYEHRGNGRRIEIYDGRVCSEEEKKVEGSSPSEIIYFRDSDDDIPDSDEDPDDDLDI